MTLLEKPRFDVLVVSVTRRCPWNCYYCAYKNDTHPELPYEEWIRFFETCLKHNALGFVMITGGEPLVYKGLRELLTFLNTSNVPYTIVTTGVGTEKDVLSIARGISTTVDFHSTEIKKSTTCLDLLRQLCVTDRYRKEEKIHGIVGEVTLTDINFEQIMENVERLLESVPYWLVDWAMIEPAWNKHYDFAFGSDTDPVSLPGAHRLTKEQWEYVIQWNLKHKDRVLFPESQNRFIKAFASGVRGRAIDYCNPLKATTIEPDGTFRLCYRIKGDIGEVVTIQRFIEEDFEEVWFLYATLAFENKKKYCEGCFWQCPWFSMELGSEGQGHPEQFQKT